jgi:hypothetical protein
LRQFRTLSLPPRLFRVLTSCIGAALLLGGCVDTATDLAASRGAPALAARPGVSPRGATVAISSIEGAPDEVASRFRQQFASVSDARDITIVAPEGAKYRLRFYLTSMSDPSGARVACVWDVFDRQGHRAQRLTDEFPVVAGSDPWAGLDEKKMAEIASRGADNLAAFLSNTPEAIATASGEGAGLSVVTAQRAPAQVKREQPPALAQAK